MLAALQVGRTPRGCSPAQCWRGQLLAELAQAFTEQTAARRYISGDQHPDHDTIADFRKRSSERVGRALFADPAVVGGAGRQGVSHGVPDLSKCRGTRARQSDAAGGYREPAGGSWRPAALEAGSVGGNGEQDQQQELAIRQESRRDSAWQRSGSRRRSRGMRVNERRQAEQAEYGDAIDGKSRVAATGQESGRATAEGTGSRTERERSSELHG